MHRSRLAGFIIDCKTDDLRLELLGAKRVPNIDAWWVMEAPTGQRFCAVRAKAAAFAAEARAWE
jgi:hypothetical protein